MTLIWVAAGGATGAMLRYLTVRYLSAAVAGFPLGTLVVNVAGSLLIGMLAGTLLAGFKLAEGPKLFFQTGLLGAFTTFSAFSLDTLQLWQAGQIKPAVTNVVLNVCLCLLAVFLGMALGSAIFERFR